MQDDYNWSGSGAPKLIGWGRLESASATAGNTGTPRTFFRLGVRGLNYLPWEASFQSRFAVMHPSSLSLLLFLAVVSCLRADLPDNWRQSYRHARAQFHHEYTALIDGGTLEDSPTHRMQRSAVRATALPSFFEGEMFDTGGCVPLQLLAQAYAKAIGGAAERALEAGEPGIAYRWMHEAAFFGGPGGRFRELVAATSRPTPSVRKASFSHPRLGWKRRTFWRVTTPHYQVDTNESAEAGIQIARQLEMLHTVWRQLFFRFWSDSSKLDAAWKNSRAPGFRRRRHRVVLFASKREYVAFLSRQQPRIEISLGFYDIDSRTSYFYGGDQDVATQLHEATHQLFQELPTSAPAVGLSSNFWVVEGIALYMESLRRQGPAANVGGYYADRLQFARYRRLQEDFYVPLQMLVSMGRDELQRHEQIRKIYSQCAGLTHFLMDGKGGRYRRAMIDYLRIVYRGSDRADSLASVLGTSLKDLDSEYLDYLRVGDELLHATRLSPDSLRSLCLGGTLVTDEGLKQIPSQAGLEWLDLAGTPVTNAGLRFVVGARRLNQVNLAGTRVNDNVLKLMALNSVLQELDMSGTPISDDGVRHLASLGHLQSLWLDDTRVTDDCISYLMDLPKLRILGCSNTKITAEGLARLRSRFSDLIIQQ